MGGILCYLANITKDEAQFVKAAKHFKESGKNILDILVFSIKDIDFINPEITLYPLLDMDTEDGRFFRDTTKSITEGINAYKKAYILSISIISKLYVNNMNEKSVAHYREKSISQKLLLGESKFRLNNINYSNDLTEGRILLDYLFANKKEEPNKSESIMEYIAFASCFMFNHNSLNQFRLYGKENDVEGTGLSLVFRDSFFSKEAQMPLMQSGDNSVEEKDDGKKYTLFRCIYIDPNTQRVITVGQKEAHLFYGGENNNIPTIETKIKNHQVYIGTVTENISIELKQLKELVCDLDQTVIEQLLMNLRYLVKDSNYKEEQECRIIKILPSNDCNIKIDKEKKRKYVEYAPLVSKYIEKIYFGPKASGIEEFKSILSNNNLNIPIEKSKNILA